jgi:hypothetical protein
MRWPCCALRPELERGGGDDAERALGPDQQRLQVIAGVVLAQRAQGMQHAAVRQHRLDAEHQLARHAVAQHVQAAGIGGQIAADLAAALRAQAQREEALGAAAACCTSASVQPASTVMEKLAASTCGCVAAAQAAAACCAGFIGRRAAAVAGVAALRHDADALLVAPGEQRATLPSAARQRHGQRAHRPGRGADDRSAGARSAASSSTAHRRQNGIAARSELSSEPLRARQ